MPPGLYGRHDHYLAKRNDNVSVIAIELINILKRQTKGAGPNACPKACLNGTNFFASINAYSVSMYQNLQIGLDTLGQTLETHIM